MPTWVINVARMDVDDPARPDVRTVTIGVTTAEWIVESDDTDSPGNATTFFWVIFKRGRLHEIGFRPHTHVSESECLAALPRVIDRVHAVGAHVGLVEPRTLLGATLA